MRRVLGRRGVHEHRHAAQLGRAANPTLRVLVHRAVDVHQLEAVRSGVDLGIPPGVVRVDRALLDAVVQVHDLADGAPRAADPNPLPLLQPQARCVVGVHLQTRAGPQLAAPRQLAMLGVEVHRLAGARRHDERAVRMRRQRLLVFLHQMVALVVVVDVGVRRLDLVDQRGVEVLGVRYARVLRLHPVGELVDVGDVRIDRVRAGEGGCAVGDVRFGDGGPHLHLGSGGHEAALLVDGRVQVVAALLATVAHLPTAVRAPTLGVPLAAVEPAFFLELRRVLREVGAVGVLLGLPPVGGVLEHAVLLLLVADVAAHLHEVVVVQVVPFVVFRVAVVPHHAHGLVQADDGNRVVDAIAHRLHAALPGTEDAARALRHAARVHLEPVQHGDHDVGAAVVRAGPQVEVQPEVQTGERLPSLQQVGLVHEVARHAHAAVDLVRRVDAVDGVPDGSGVGPSVPVAQQREALGGNLLLVAVERRLERRPRAAGLVGAALTLGDPARLFGGGNLVAVALGQGRFLVDEVLHEVLDQRDLVFHGQVARGVAQLHGAHVQAPVLRLMVGHQHVGAAAAAVHLGLRRTAVAGGLVGVAGDAGDQLQRAGVLHRVARLVGSKLVVDAAVAVQRVQARRVDAHALLDLVDRHLGDLGHVLQRVLLQAVGERLPHRVGADGGAVLQLHLHAAGEQRRVLGQPGRVRALAALVALVPVGVVLRVGRIGELGGVGQPGVRDDGLVRMLDPGARRRDLVLLALPLAGLGIPVRRLVVVLVPADEALVAALVVPVLADPLGVAVGLGQDAALHVDAAVHFHEPTLRRAAVLLGVPQERGVRPTAHERVVVRLVVEDPLEPTQRQAQVGAHAQRQPHVGFLAQRRHAGIHQDVLVGALRAVHHRTVRGVVVRVLRRGAPLHVHQRALLNLHPRRADLVGEDAAEVARTLADLVGQVRVRRGEDGLQRAVRRLRPHARGAAHGEVGFPAVLLHDLLELGTRLVERLGKRDAHPTGVVLAFGVRALHAVAQTIGMVQSQHGRLRLRAAVTAAVSVGLVALDLDDLVVLNGHPHAALHLAARAAAGADALDLAR